ncbi:MAG: GyrI-like domain-containing protein [Chloroflexi bacterium]|nr:GyrI-like domain-containing protein [Chloroflexota bacterium]
MTPRKADTGPQLLQMPPRKMAVMSARGAPDRVFTEVMPLLYGAVYTYKFALKKKGLPTFKVEPPRARYPDAHLVPKDQWTIVLGLPVPDDTTELPDAGRPVKVETWEYGTVAQILHTGAYDRETSNIQRLREFIEENGYEIAGDHEEEYLTRPGAKAPKTIIRYPVRKKPG